VRNSGLFLSVLCDEELLLVSHHSMDTKIHSILWIYRNYYIVFDLLRIYFLQVVAWEPYTYDIPLYNSFRCLTIINRNLTEKHVVHFFKTLYSQSMFFITTVDDSSYQMLIVFQQQHSSKVQFGHSFGDRVCFFILFHPSISLPDYLPLLVVRDSLS